MLENQQYDKKSLRILTKSNPDWKEIAKDCVAFANAAGGYIIFGIEDAEELPPAGQVIEQDIVNTLLSRIQSNTTNVAVVPEIATAENNSQYLRLLVKRNNTSIASTSDGKYYLRIGDKCTPIVGDDIQRLLQDKGGYVWELQHHVRVTKQEVDQVKLKNFIQDVKQSERVSDFIKQQDEDELLQSYMFVQNGLMTNLGILWLGKAFQRAKLLYSPTVQFIKYDEYEKKVNKLVWDDYSLNPKELLQDIWNRVLDFKENIEFPDGLFRKNIYNYDEVVIRELLANALVHRPYGTRGDIFINLYTDRLEIHNPGTFPLGVTSKNILHQSVQRNPQLARVFYDLKLMEKEGSGYDKIYETLLSSAKPLPEPVEENDRVVVTIRKRIMNLDVINFMDKVSREIPLKTKELIALGLIAQHNSLSAFEISKILNLENEDKAKDWIGKLPEYGLIVSRGKTKGVSYSVAPMVLKELNFKGLTNLKKIEPHRLRELIREDLNVYKTESFGEIHKHIGLEIPIRTLRTEIEKMVKEDLLRKIGKNKGLKYELKI